MKKLLALTLLVAVPAFVDAGIRNNNDDPGTAGETRRGARMAPRHSERRHRMRRRMHHDDRGREMRSDVYGADYDNDDMYGADNDATSMGTTSATGTEAGTAGGTTMFGTQETGAGTTGTTGTTGAGTAGTGDTGMGARRTDFNNQ